ncbi:MAG: DNA replication and repair protein RecF [Rhodothermales bacterium]|nr:DNA replication and repair protein RecF [Rhodothermales bacterium]
MVLRKLTLRSFRAHTESDVDFAVKVNTVCGPNGAGKTNLLEAIHFACLSKSFLTPNDAYALRRGDPFFEITARFVSSVEAEATVRVAFVPGEGKSVMINGSRLERLSDLVGRFPVVVLSPADHDITSGGPEERRRLVDNILSQAHPVYLADLLTYRRALRQRNALLKSMVARHAPTNGQLASWTEECAALGSRLVHRRQRFVSEFSGYLDEAYRTIESVSEKPSIRYRTLVEPGDREQEPQIHERYVERFSEAQPRELEQGRTLVGPHRDEFVFYLDGMEVRRYASQGQHRTFALALKLAQYLYIQESAEEPPIFLLDDALDNLDPSRRAAILRLLESDAVGQSVITAADEEIFSGLLDGTSASNRRVRVQSGRVVAPVG